MHRNCSDACAFWSKVDKNGPTVRAELGPCWVWIADKKPGKMPYGRFEIHGKKHGSHRYSWELAHGAIPDGISVLHRCDNPSCVRPGHLFLGTQADNINDKLTKGRSADGERNGAYTRSERRPIGERNGLAKLTPKDVVDIRASFGAGRETQTDIAIRLGVSQSVIWSIVHGKTWRHVA